MMKKKGAIEGLMAMIVPLIAIGIILTIGFLIFAEAKDKIVETTSVSTTNSNESFTGWTSGTYKALTYSDNCMTLSCSELRNGTGSSAVISTTLYNCTVGRGLQVTNGTTDGLFTTLYVDYTCANKTIAYNATGDLQNATQDIPGWLPVIIITVIGGLLIGLVMRFRQ